LKWLKRNRIYIAIVLILCCLGAAVVIYGHVNRVPSACSKCEPWANLRDGVQIAVTAYATEHAGQWPPVDNGTCFNVILFSPIEYPQFSDKHAYACPLDICVLINSSSSYRLRRVLDGILGNEGEAGTNFYSGKCKNDACKGPYVLVMDDIGNVYTVCDVSGDGFIQEDGIENVNARGGGSGESQWPDCRTWWEKRSSEITYIVIILIVSIIVLSILLICLVLRLWYLHSRRLRKRDSEGNKL
jgi:hypothetical protein